MGCEVGKSDRRLLKAEMVKKSPHQKGKKGLNSIGRPRKKLIQGFLEVRIQQNSLCQVTLESGP